MDLFFKLKVAIKLLVTSFREKLRMRFLLFPSRPVHFPQPAFGQAYGGRRGEECPKNEDGVKVLWFVLLLFASFTSFAQDVLLQQKAARLYKTGFELMAQNQYAAARENFSQYLSSNPPSGTQKQDAEYYRAICSLNLYHVDAEKQLQDFIDNNPSSAKSTVAYADLATFFYNEKNYKKAANYFAKADLEALSPSEQTTARFRWGYSLFSQKILKDALDQFNFIKAQGGQYGPAASYYAGFAEYSLGDNINALIDLKRAEQAEAYASIVPYLIANVYYKQKDYDALIVYAHTKKLITKMR